MRDVKRFPTTTGLSWLEMSSFKDHLFKGHEKIGKEYDYVIVGGGYGGYGCASRLAELQPEARIAVFEAIKIGNGDSGKNAGFIIDVPHNFGDQGNSTFEDNEMYYKLNTFIIGLNRYFTVHDNFRIIVEESVLTLRFNRFKNLLQGNLFHMEINTCLLSINSL